jgi:uncharacterized protein (DUF3084 family)
MKKAKSVLQIPAINSGVKYKTNDREELNMENLIVSNREDLEEKLKSIENNIEEIGILCDRKKEKSLEDCQNVIKINKSKEQEILTKLNSDLLETIKLNTKEDYLNGLKKEVANLKQHIDKKDKELVDNNGKLYTLENNINYLKDEKCYLKKEIKNAKTYNMYLKTRLKELEMSPAKVETSQQVVTNKALDVTKQAASLPCNIEVSEKLELYLKRNENILLNKITAEERVYQDRITTLKNLELFNNSILEILASKVKDYQMNSVQAKITNEDIFFSNSSFSNKHNSSNTLMKVYICDNNIEKYSNV